LAYIIISFFGFFFGPSYTFFPEPSGGLLFHLFKVTTAGGIFNHRIPPLGPPLHSVSRDFALLFFKGFIPQVSFIIFFYNNTIFH
jgi:hypothetical protein